MAIAYVLDTGKIRAENVNTSAASFGVLPAVNNHVFTLVSGWHNTVFDLSSVADNQSNTYVIDKAQNDGSSSAKAEASITSSKVETSAGTFTVTISPQDTSGNYIEWIAAEFSGLVTTSWLDKTGSATTASGVTTITATASAQNSQADVLVLACFVDNVADPTCNITTPTGYTALFVNQDATATIGAQGSYKIVSAIETSAATWNFDNIAAGGSGAAIATFKAAAAAGQTLDMWNPGIVRPHSGQIGLVTY